jgi:hypothetical protein
MKGAISYPMVIIVSMIIGVVILVLAYYFMYQGSTEIAKSFSGFEQSFRKWECSLFGSLGGAVCG